MSSITFFINVSKTANLNCNLILSREIKKYTFPQLRSLLSSGMKIDFLTHISCQIDFSELLQIYIILKNLSYVYNISFVIILYISYIKIFCDNCLF